MRDPAEAGEILPKPSESEGEGGLKGEVKKGQEIEIKI